jgi:abelson tyrosine-protein kinase 1
MSIQIRTLKLIQVNELRRQKESDTLLTELGLASFPSGSAPEPETPPMDPKEIARRLARVRREQNSRDRARDVADLRQLMRAALQTNDDATMIEVLQVGRDEMPEAIKTLQRALEREMARDLEREDDDGASASSGSEAAPQFRPRGRARSMTIAVGALQAQRERDALAQGQGLAQMQAAPDEPPGDTLDREFLEGGIEALRRLSQGTDIAVPSWTITRYEVDLEEKIGIGFFSDVYKARWRAHAVAVKVLAETTPKAMFVREMGIWKKLEHPNVVELLGASSATGEPPWFCACFLVVGAVRVC